MAFETTKNILDHAREFHSQLSEFYCSLSTQSEKQRVKMLLDYMSQQERHLEDTLARYEEQLSEQALNTWFQYPPPKEILNICKEVTMAGKGDLTVDDVIAMVVKLDQCLIDLFKDAVEKADTDALREIFQNLQGMEKRYQLELVRDAQEWKDL
jgi:rubrerythrin